ncbi:EcoRII [Burkholderia sp. WAC0059]|uniref:type II restriction endonuclease n=1 Tax=Burkholderia sp. WAC0059 TaxID=2066022 RepID=UPI000C7F284E|nr:type II restriction endonuclease [Burkholderia sp. WAC0059]PLZ02038.1 EcoRII [Burkholderia sp. WAC0059]
MRESQRENIEQWMRQSRCIAIKKLARNDCQWADSRDSHQNGFYVPRALMDGEFFPPTHQRTDKRHIWETTLPTLWISFGETRRSRLVRYTNKGRETHFTGVPKEEFASLSPASLLLVGLLAEPVAGAFYWFVVVDSVSEDAEWLETLYNIDAEFEANIFGIADPAAQETLNAQRLQAELVAAIEAGTLHAFIQEAAVLPDPATMAQRAQEEWKRRMHVPTLDPWQMLYPGDAIMEISRDVEFDLFKRLELRHRAAQVIQLLGVESPDGLAGAVVRGFAELNAIFLSASQVRKSRAGRSFEHHISSMLTAGNILHHAQAVRGSTRPDFVLPTLERVLAATGVNDEAMILSAKTTLRERWKQVSLEQVNSAFFLATVDDRVSADAIDAMAAQDIVLVVPERLKYSNETVYRQKSNVITFFEFFRHEIRERRPSLIRPA